VTIGKKKNMVERPRYTKRIWREREHKDKLRACVVYKNGEGLVVMMMMIMMTRIRPRTL
jgi:hypothetical protein